MEMRRKTVSFKADEPTEAGVLTGYGSVFGGSPDSYNEIVDAGAFAESLERHAKAESMPSMLWQHDPRMPIGAWTEMSEDKHGLKVEGQLALGSAVGGDEKDDVKLAREAYTLLRMKALNGLSIGYLPIKRVADEDNKEVFHLQEVELMEVSLVTFPANTRAQVGAVKSVRDLEMRLRDAGFSRREAVAIASHGYMGLERSARDARDAIDLEAVARRLDAVLARMKGK